MATDNRTAKIYKHLKLEGETITDFAKQLKNLTEQDKNDLAAAIDKMENGTK